MRLASNLIRSHFSRSFSTGKLVPPKFEPTVRQRPMPLENIEDQEEMERLIQKGGGENQQTIIVKDKKQFEGETNPKTGEIGGPKGMEPTRFGDWEKNGRISDF